MSFEKEPQLDAEKGDVEVDTELIPQLQGDQLQRG